MTEPEPASAADGAAGGEEAAVKEDHRRGPRRRGAALEDALLTAALAELNESGYAALTMEAVAQRAGASKASLYRRWDSRAALVRDAVHRLAPQPRDIPDTGTLRGDLLAVLVRTAETLQGPAGDALRGMLAETLPDVKGFRELRSGSRGRSRLLMAEVTRRAVARGEIAADAVTERRLEVGTALLRNRLLFDGAAVDDALLGEIVDEVLLPLLGTVPTPGRRSRT